MSERYGKNFDLNSGGIIQPRGVCTGFCPVLCRLASGVTCKCTNDQYQNKGSSYYTNYNKIVMDNRTPDL